MNVEISNFLASFPNAVSTRRTYADVLGRVLDLSHDLSSLTAGELFELIDRSGWGNSRQCVALAVSLKFLRWKYGVTHPALSARLKRIPGPPQRALDPATALKLLESFDVFKAKGTRDLALCAVALDTGLRAAELCRLRTVDVDLDRFSLQVLVKGGQWMAAVFDPPTAGYIGRWLNYRVGLGETLFTHVWTGEALTPEGLNQIVRGWGVRLGIRLSPHDLRRTFATIGTLLGASERALMEGGRWSHADMIKRYTRSLRVEAMRPFLPVQGLLDGRLEGVV